jgi:large subunit ribosomal protein L29|tara:strand:- start:588 stop:803 length:216 start_codon:yes stop_codon:yes gene_type:complete
MKVTEFNIKLNGLSKAELEELLSDTRSSLSKLKMNHKTAELENPIELRDLRRNVARILTELRSREIQEANK